MEKLREVGLDVPLAASLAHRLRVPRHPAGGDILNTRTCAPRSPRRRPLAIRLMQRDGHPPILELKSFSHTYLEGTPRASEAVRDVSFEIQAASASG